MQKKNLVSSAAWLDLSSECSQISQNQNSSLKTFEKSLEFYRESECTRLFLFPALCSRSFCMTFVPPLTPYIRSFFSICNTKTRNWISQSESMLERPKCPTFFRYACLLRIGTRTFCMVVFTHSTPCSCSFACVAFSKLISIDLFLWLKLKHVFYRAAIMVRHTRATITSVNMIFNVV